MLSKTLNTRTQNYSKSTLEEANDFDESLLDEEIMTKIRQENFKTILLQEGITWIRSNNN